MAADSLGAAAEVEIAAKEIFVMIDADHSNTADNDEVNDFLHCIGEPKVDDISEMNQSQFIEMAVNMNKGKQILKWWWDQRVISQSLNTSVQLLLIIYTPVTKKLFQFDW